MAPVYITVLLLIVILGSTVWVGLGLTGAGIVAISIFRPAMPYFRHLAFSLWNTAITPTMIALALFILMAEILFRTKLSNLIFSGLAPWVTWIPGKLMHTNVIGCTLFAAVSGSSAATAATIGKVTLAELDKRGYNHKISVGSLAGSGTLGFLIPPSTMLIIYGTLAEESVLKLFLAGFIPGIIIAILYIGYIIIYSLYHKNIAPVEETNYTYKEKLKSLINLGPIVFLILLIMIAMYGGYATPTEAAAVGVFGSLLIGFFQRSLSFEAIKDALMAATRTISMIGFIIIGAVFLSQIMGFLAIPSLIATRIAALNLSPLVLIALLLLVFIFLGCIMDGMAILVMTLPITLPLMLQAGYTKIWFGIFMVIAIQLAQITPPVGFNLFIIQGLTGDDMGYISKAAFPFFIIMVLFALLIAIFPEIVTYIPDQIVFRG
jgi:tripartite ATP-independent transporter DctM subunit